MSLASNEPSESSTTVEHSSGAIDPARPLVLHVTLRQQIVTHLASWLPNEGCGLLASMVDGGMDRATHFFPGTNIDRSPVRYTMAPQEVIDALRMMREAGWDLAAIVHSHPRTAPVPSQTDLAEAYYPDARLLIVSFAGRLPELTCWSLSSDRKARAFFSAPLVLDDR